MSRVINVFETLRQDMDGLVQFPLADGDADDAWSRPQQLYLECLTRLLNREHREDLIRQLVHFLALCNRAGLIPLDVLWDTPPYPRFFQQKLADTEFASDQGLVANTREGSTFIVYWTAMPALSTCAQLLYFTSGQVDFSEVLSRIDAQPDGFSALEDVMRFWADGFDRYRQAKGGSSQADKRYRAVKSFLASACDGEGYTCTEISTRHVVDFWRQHWQQESLAMKTYKTNHEVFVDFAQAYASEIDAFAAQSAASIDAVYTTTGSTAELQDHPTYSAWQNLTRHSPEFVKLLKGTAWHPLDVVACVAPAAAGLRHSAVLAHCAAELNNKIGRANAAKRQTLYQQLQQHGFDESYAALRDAAHDALTLLEKAIWASAHVLLSGGTPEGVMLMAQLDDDMASFLEQLATDLPQQDSSNLQQQLVTRFYQQIGPQDSFPQQIDAAMQKTMTCWKDMSLQGFKPKDIDRAEVVEELSALAVDMAAALVHARTGTKFLTTMSPDIQRQDERTLLAVLQQIYDSEPQGVT